MLDQPTAHARMREAGLRLTPQRRAVVEALVGDSTHPTAEDVASRVSAGMPGVSLSTVYKVLHELSDLGLVRPVEVPGAMRFDPDETDHAHVVCDACGTISDVPLPTVALETLRAAGGGPGRVSRVDVVVHATCPACA